MSTAYNTISFCQWSRITFIYFITDKNLMLKGQMSRSRWHCKPFLSSWTWCRNFFKFWPVLTWTQRWTDWIGQKLLYIIANGILQEHLKELKLLVGWGVQQQSSYSSFLKCTNAFFFSVLYKCFCQLQIYSELLLNSILSCWIIRSINL